MHHITLQALFKILKHFSFCSDYSLVGAYFVLPNMLYILAYKSKNFGQFFALQSPGLCLKICYQPSLP